MVDPIKISSFYGTGSYVPRFMTSSSTNKSHPALKPEHCKKSSKVQKFGKENGVNKGVRHSIKKPKKSPTVPKLKSKITKLPSMQKLKSKTSVMKTKRLVKSKLKSEKSLAKALRVSNHQKSTNLNEEKKQKGILGLYSVRN